LQIESDFWDDTVREGEVMRRRSGNGGGSAGTFVAAMLAVVGPAAPAAAQEAEVVVRAAWGPEPGQLGRRDADESAPEGPMSFVVAPAGDVWILDQVNARLVRFGADGRFEETIGIGSVTFQGLALGPGGELVLVDRLAARTVLVLASDGTRLGQVGLEGHGIPEGGGTTAVFARDDGVWIEYDHRRSVRVLDAQWRDPFYRRELPGRPVGPGAVRGVAWREAPFSVGVQLFEGEAEAPRAETELRFEEPVRRIVELAGDGQGNVVLAVHLATEDPARGWATVHEALEVLVLDAALVERRRIVTSPSAGPWEQTKELEVRGDGTIWQMAFGEAGVEVRRWRP
jgi:hypothetical protein